MTTLTDRCDEAMARAIWGEWSLWASPIREPKPRWDDLAEGNKDTGRRVARAARLALLSALDAEGWQVVPKVATDGMIAAVRRLDWKSQTDIDWPEGYAAMLAAAPHPFPEDKP